MGALALLLASAVCMSAPLQEQSNGSYFVKVGPLVGYVGLDDSVNRRFSLRVGPLRTKSGLSQKIPWFPESGAKIGDTLVVTGKALSLPKPRSFTQTFRAASYGSGRMMFPTIIAPPSTGCWMFTFKTGPTTASIAVLVRPRPT